MNQWQGKKWYCYGTSMTNNRIHKGKNGEKVRTGYFSEKLCELSGLVEYNFGIGGSGIIPHLHKGENVKTRCMTLEDGKAEADLITLEVVPNDMNGELGEVTDLSDDTFCGNLNQILAYLLENTKATVVVLIATRGRYNAKVPSTKYYPWGKICQKRVKWELAVETVCRMHGVPCWNGAAEAGMGYFRIARDNTLVQDQIHLTEKGGELLARYYWGKLKNLYPYD